jgi:hypothetical protein
VAQSRWRIGTPARSTPPQAAEIGPNRATEMGDKASPLQAASAGPKWKRVVLAPKGRRAPGTTGPHARIAWRVPAALAKSRRSPRPTPSVFPNAHLDLIRPTAPRTPSLDGPQRPFLSKSHHHFPQGLVNGSPSTTAAVEAEEAVRILGQQVAERDLGHEDVALRTGFDTGLEIDTDLWRQACREPYSFAPQ